jgi:hypothetical protein
LCHSYTLELFLRCFLHMPHVTNWHFISSFLQFHKKFDVNLLNYLSSRKL